MVTHRMHQVRLTQANATIKEQRVVTMLGVVRHLPGGRAGQLVGFTLDEVLKGKGTVEVAGVLERTFNLHGALFSANRCLLGTGTRHWIEAVAGWLFVGRRVFLSRRFRTCRRRR